MTLAPDWVCEILSPSTEAVDRSDKMSIDARERVPHVWLVDPAVETLEIFRLDGATYRILRGVHAPRRGHAVTRRIRVVFAALPLALACGGLTTTDAANGKDPCRGSAVCGEGCEDFSDDFSPRARTQLLPPPYSERCFVDCSKDEAACPAGTSCTTIIRACGPNETVCELGIPLHHICAGPNDLDWSRRYSTRDAGPDR